MRRRALNCIVLGGFLVSGFHSWGQSSLDILEQDLNQAKQEHQESTSQIIVGFFSQLDEASKSADSALNLYETAGGALPDLTEVDAKNDYETPDEKAIRLAQDQTNLSNLGAVLQLHCGLMRFAGLFIIRSEQKGLHEDWIAWLKTAAQLYPTLKQDKANADSKDEASKNGDTKGDTSHKRWKQQKGNSSQKGNGGGQATPSTPASADDTSDYRQVMMKNSIISTYLGFHGWGDKEQGQWKVKDLPRLYRTNILDPLRTALSPDTLAAWDTYIAMKSADQPDSDKWNSIDLPALQFDRASDDFAIKRSTEKLATLVALVKANPTHPQFEDWTARVHQMIKDYRDQKAGNAPSAPAIAPAHADDSPSATTKS